MNYFIQIENHIDNTIKIVNKITNLDTYSSDFNTIINQLNTDNTFESVYCDHKAELFKTETIIVKGYIYNSTKIIKTLVYTLTLIQCDNTLSQLFKNHVNNTSQTNIPSQQEQTDTINTMMFNLNINDNENTYQNDNENKDGNEAEVDTDIDTDSEFGEFQSAPPTFTTTVPTTLPIDLNSYTTNTGKSNKSNNSYNSYKSKNLYSNSYKSKNSYNSYNSYNPCNSYNFDNFDNLYSNPYDIYCPKPVYTELYKQNYFTHETNMKSDSFNYLNYSNVNYFNSSNTDNSSNSNNSFNSDNSYNPFNKINGLRDYNTDIYINKGSKPSLNPTNIHNTELISELKLRLTQPNSGLKPSVSNNLNVKLI
jgi:hypothetical protein